jgi:hypothetical protein
MANPHCQDTEAMRKSGTRVVADTMRRVIATADVEDPLHDDLAERVLEIHVVAVLNRPAS